jgi:hypothetical protein
MTLGCDCRETWEVETMHLKADKDVADREQPEICTENAMQEMRER